MRYRAYARPTPVVLVAGLLLLLVAPAGADDNAEAAWRGWVEREILVGRIDQPFVDAARWQNRDPVALWPLAVRDLWWRPASAADRREVFVQAAERAPAVLKPPYQWLLDGGAGPFPAPPTAQDPWPVITALILDRQQRESQGRIGLPASSPLYALGRGPEGTSEPAFWSGWRAWFLDTHLDTVYRDPDARRLSPEDEAERERLDGQARSHRHAHVMLLGALAVLFSTGAGLVLWRTRRRDRG